VSGGLRRAGEGEELRVVAAATVGVMIVNSCEEGGWITICGNAVGKMDRYLYAAISKQDIMSDEDAQNIVDVLHSDWRGAYSKEAQPRQLRRQSAMSPIF